MVTNQFYRRLSLERLRLDMERRAQRRQDLITEYADFHDRTWLESMSYAELVCALHSGLLTQPCLPLDNRVD